MKAFWQKIREKARRAAERAKRAVARKFGPGSPLREQAKRMLHATFGHTTHDKMLERAYVGAKYDTFARRRFNVSGFFLSSLYMFYRRMYVSGLVVFALNITLIVLTHNLVPSSRSDIWVDVFHQVLIGLLVGFLVNKYYLWTVARKVMRIKAKYQGKTRLELKGICEVLGGVKLRGAVPATLLEVVVTIAMLLVFAVQYVVERVSGSVVHVEATLQEAESEVETVIHGEIPDVLKGITEQIFKK